MNNRIFCVVSHTHWDREWYMPLEQFRLRLVDLIDHLIEIVEKHPEYIFHLDAQAIVLEDYLEVRPDRKELLKCLIRDGQIIVGPWYLQNDFYLTSGEATVRNLLEGIRITTEFGASGKVGYAPDQFGNISQLPQILGDFGIDNFVFARGYSEYIKEPNGVVSRILKPTEFIWKGADGSEVLAVYMKDWYNNAQRISPDSRKALALLNGIENSFDHITATPYLLLMNGVDHLEAQDDLFDIIASLRPQLPEGKQLLQYNLDDYIHDVKKYIKENNISLPAHQGELRQGSDMELLKGTLSSRHYLKVSNVAAQCLLENKLEPLYAMLEAAGMHKIYPRDHLRRLWKMLIQNHPHDSICGCSRDEVHGHMEDLYKRFFEFGNDLLTRGLKYAAEHTTTAREHPEDYVITVTNTLQEPSSGVVEAEVRFLSSDDVQGFTIMDEQGVEIEYAVTEKVTKLLDVFSPLNLPGTVKIDCYRLYLYENGVEPWAIKSYLVKRSQNQVPYLDKAVKSTFWFETNLLGLKISECGRIDLLDKQSGRVLNDCIYIEDTADHGDAYVYIPCDEQAILSKEFTPSISVLEDNAYKTRIILEWKMRLPAGYDFDNACRSKETCENTVAVILTMKKDQPWLEVEYQTDNHAENHRMRLIVKADFVADCTTADIPFDVVTHSDSDHFCNTWSRVLPNTSFTVIEKDSRGMAVFTAGAHEYEHIDGDKLAFTILRATGAISLGAGEVWQVPENNCKRIMGGRLGILPYHGDFYQAGVITKAIRFRNPLLIYSTSCNKKNFSGGRPAVQDSSMSELFYPKDVHDSVVLKNNYSAFSVNGENIAITAVKQAQSGKGLIIRMVNLGTEETTAVLTANNNIFVTNMAESHRHYIGRDQVNIKMGGKKIKTIWLLG